MRPLPAREPARGRTAQRQHTAAAVRMVSESPRPWAAIGARAAASSTAAVLREGIEDEANNVTRFVWVAPPGTEPARQPRAHWKTSLIFSELGEDHPGALVEALQRVLRRAGSTSRRIESRPCAPELGRYMFFCRPRRQARRRAGRGRDRGAARQGRIGPHPRLLSAGLGTASPPPYNSRHHGQGAGAQCDRMSRSTSARCAAPPCCS